MARSSLLRLTDFSACSSWKFQKAFPIVSSLIICKKKGLCENKRREEPVVLHSSNRKLLSTLCSLVRTVYYLEDSQRELSADNHQHQYWRFSSKNFEMRNSIKCFGKICANSYNFRFAFTVNHCKNSACYSKLISLYKTVLSFAKNFF